MPGGSCIPPTGLRGPDGKNKSQPAFAADPNCPQEAGVARLPKGKTNVRIALRKSDSNGDVLSAPSTAPAKAAFGDDPFPVMRKAPAGEHKKHKVLMVQRASIF